ncbi:MAG: 50S ribosomal protein L9 [Actinomyces succiniciruminis]|uniref:Large ribosomal subunit protein bL9 n=1 Tax=Actinomyces succiniciruminis TaxID=1522002 RepID=A0A1L7RM60_9ACTO|nr:50S ribosomal protein L9 [Actinomyces succiniciruminis]MBE6474560.1 50S ribosomal protein L9 [Actinomyces succiniciruminis]MBE6482720.1 50S ribosomal protein L9 [Actinomyces ruminicola]MBM6978689.1 50S ribosomal protein L9 [Actinomyces succiniciruminis]CED90153.1 50S ribosomal protein L9 [Actinomyces succiniciruminis]
MTTKLILTHDVTNLGAAGEVVEVKDGYARNYLVPRKLATPWTKGAQRQIDQMAEARRKRAIDSLEQAQEARAWLSSNVITVTASAGDNGRLFGAVTTAQLADGVKEAGGPAIDRRKIQVIPPIKSTGRHSATVRLHPDVVAPLEVNVVAAR